MKFTERLKELQEKADSGVLVLGPAAEMALRKTLRDSPPAIIEALEAAKRLKNEVKDDILAFLYLFPYLRTEIGNTNFNILQMRVDEMEAALAVLDALVEEKTP